MCHVSNHYLFTAFLQHHSQLEDGASSHRHMQEKIGDLEQRLSRDVAASRDVDSLRTELQEAKMKIDRLQMDDSIAQYDFDLTLSYLSEKVFYCLVLRHLVMDPMHIPELTARLQNPQVQYSLGSTPKLDPSPLSKCGHSLGPIHCDTHTRGIFPREY